jgi:hypothetical protein
VYNKVFIYHIIVSNNICTAGAQAFLMDNT